MMAINSKVRFALILLSGVACFAGFTLQVANISSLYFGYPTTTRVVSRHQSDEEFGSPLLVFCSEAWSHLDTRNMTRAWVSEKG